MVTYIWVAFQWESSTSLDFAYIPYSSSFLPHPLHNIRSEWNLEWNVEMNRRLTSDKCRRSFKSFWRDFSYTNNQTFASLQHQTPILSLLLHCYNVRIYLSLYPNFHYRCKTPLFLPLQTALFPSCSWVFCSGMKRIDAFQREFSISRNAIIQNCSPSHITRLSRQSKNESSFNWNHPISPDLSLINILIFINFTPWYHFPSWAYLSKV